MMKNLDTTRSEKLAKGLKYYVNFVNILTYAILIIWMISMIVIGANSLEYDSDGSTFGSTWMGFFLGGAIYWGIVQILLWFTKIFWNAFVALTESAEYNIAHIKEIHNENLANNSKEEN
ncbi:MAG: hypothetical protein UIG52_02725 [Bacteroidales bacterium]|nr:hypothetical protein [Bacteroidales bacterium]MEE1001682.1 hypothetical protein [Bacteroidales bacterium]